ncbi:MAG: zinc ribbon domain-containing protein [Pelagibacteraceae bacterium]|nr:zinc ribbon domain-containing protein [Pelagibacteraceae bacterium]
MPIYEYKCPTCGLEKEILQGMNDPNPLCPKCCYNPDATGSAEIMKKKISKSAFHFKGSGFYQTDYKKSGYSAPDKKAETTAGKSKKKKKKK